MYNTLSDGYPVKQVNVALKARIFRATTLNLELEIKYKKMGKVKVAAFTISLDGYGAGAYQDLANPMGIGTKELHAWMLSTKMFMKMTGREGGSEGVDNDFAEQSMQGLGAWIMGRNMFGPVRGPWPDEEWKGWWGKNPPYHVPVYVLTQYPRDPVHMEGDTVFHFVTDGIESALAKAKVAAGDKDIRIGGGVSTVRQFLKAGLIDEIHLVVSPVIVGSGENLWEGIDLIKMGFEVKRRWWARMAPTLSWKKNKANTNIEKQLSSLIFACISIFHTSINKAIQTAPISR
ncbi:dihydrofolate reductase family protein [Ferruginibacter sp.]